ncbi:MAG: ImmA/IrrE family metallo-endopeptidase [Mycobacterium sp.]|nr:ImmA/IrrE family metallo-endopeptidase [Mycobacterium sp.]
MTSTTHAFRPDYAIAPGETLRDRLAEMNLSQAELAARAGMSTKHVNQIMQGHAPITLETAVALERITGVPASFWNRREADYREALLRSRPHEFTSEDEKWLASLPLKELQKRHRLPQARDRGSMFDAVLSFFGVADREAWERIWRGPVASFRRSQAYASHPGAVVAWLRIAEIDAQERKAEPYSAPAFRKALQEVRALTAGGDPNDLVELCAAAGVVVVFVPEVARCRISGAAWWATPNRAVIALSDRYKKDDFFWFTFFHESAHILLHSKRETFVDDGSDDDLLEDEANRFAADLLIPREHAPRLAVLATESDVVAFAEELGVAPGIVVGRLQHEGHWGWNRGHPLKRTLHIIES